MRHEETEDAREERGHSAQHRPLPCPAVELLLVDDIGMVGGFVEVAAGRERDEADEEPDDAHELMVFMRLRPDPKPN